MFNTLKKVEFGCRIFPILIDSDLGWIDENALTLEFKVVVEGTQKYWNLNMSVNKIYWINALLAKNM